jgi:hypothetical protein
MELRDDERVFTIHSSKRGHFNPQVGKIPDHTGYFCGTKRCPARGKPRYVCKGLGHSASVCKTKKTNVHAINPARRIYDVFTCEDFAYKECTYVHGWNNFLSINLSFERFLSMLSLLTLTAEGVLLRVFSLDLLLLFHCLR